MYAPACSAAFDAKRTRFGRQVLHRHLGPVAIIYESRSITRGCRVFSADELPCRLKHQACLTLVTPSHSSPQALEAAANLGMTSLVASTGQHQACLNPVHVVDRPHLLLELVTEATSWEKKCITLVIRMLCR